jgi:hypothetical protein
MKQSLDAIANILTNGECDADTLDWAALRYQNTAAVQAILLERYAPVTVKKMMAALRRVLQEARKLKLMDAESYSTAVDLPQIKVSKKLRGRALTQSEIAALVEVCQNDPTLQAGCFHSPKCDRYLSKKSSNFPVKFSLIFIR